MVIRLCKRFFPHGWLGLVGGSGWAGWALGFLVGGFDGRLKGIAASAAAGSG